MCFRYRYLTDILLISLSISFRYVSGMNRSVCDNFYDFITETLKNSRKTRENSAARGLVAYLYIWERVYR